MKKLKGGEVRGQLLYCCSVVPDVPAAVIGQQMICPPLVNPNTLAVTNLLGLQSCGVLGLDLPSLCSGAPTLMFEMCVCGCTHLNLIRPVRALPLVQTFRNTMKLIPHLFTQKAHAHTQAHRLLCAARPCDLSVAVLHELTVTCHSDSSVGPLAFKCVRQNRLPFGFCTKFTCI